MSRFAAPVMLVLLLAACGDSSGEPGTIPADLVQTTMRVPAAATTAQTTAASITAVPTTAAAPATTMAMHDDDATHDDDTHDDTAAAEPEPADFDREVEVVMTEFAFEPPSISVTAGETVRFVLVNEGLVPHEFRLTTAHAAAEHIAAGHEGHDDEASEGEASEGEHGHDEVLVEVAPGATDTLTVAFTADADFDQFTCLIPGHYEAGMFGELQIGA